jgi:hypothetical protein
MYVSDYWHILVYTAMYVSDYLHDQVAMHVNDYMII